VTTEFSGPKVMKIVLLFFLVPTWKQICWMTMTKIWEMQLY